MTARHWRPDGEDARCLLCPHRCRIAPGETGLCRARRNVGGTLAAESYGRLTSLALDPIEKKPLYHFHPGSRVLSAGSYGCNLDCPFCQNYQIASREAPSRGVTPEELAGLSAEAGHGNIGVAFTYNEPLIAFEYVADCAELLRQHRQKVVLVTNGFVSPEPLAELLPLADAFNIDLKCFSQEGYRSLGGSLEPVLHTIAAAAGVCHVEVTTLVVPGLSDSAEEMDALAAWIADIRPDIPLHVSRYFPRHRMEAPATPVETVCALAEVARGHLRHVYTGNC